MMRQAMMLSISDASSGTAAAAPQPQVPPDAMREGIQGFEAVTGAGGTTAQFYVYTALLQGEPVETAIHMYFDNNCSPPPQGWSLPGADGSGPGIGG